MANWRDPVGGGGGPLSGSIITASQDFRGSVAFSPLLNMGVLSTGMVTVGRIDTANTFLLFGYDGTSPTFRLTSTGILGWNSSATSAATAPDLILVRDAANTLAQKNGNVDQVSRQYGGNGGYWETGAISELLVLNTGALFTDTAANLLPANAIIEAITARITTTITTSANWSLGDATIAARFAAANATLTAGTTTVGLQHVDQTGTSGPKQVAAAKLRVTLNANPGAGAIRITSYYRVFVPATS